MTTIYSLNLPNSTRGLAIALSKQHPTAVTRQELMRAGFFEEHRQGRVGAYACFEYQILRLQDALRPHGWTVDDTGEMYRLVKLGAA